MAVLAAGAPSRSATTRPTARPTARTTGATTRPSTWTRSRCARPRTGSAGPARRRPSGAKSGPAASTRRGTPTTTTRAAGRAWIAVAHRRPRRHGRSRRHRLAWSGRRGGIGWSGRWWRGRARSVGARAAGSAGAARRGVFWHGDLLTRRATGVRPFGAYVRGVCLGRGVEACGFRKPARRAGRECT